MYRLGIMRLRLFFFCSVVKQYCSILSLLWITALFLEFHYSFLNQTQVTMHVVFLFVSLTRYVEPFNFVPSLSLSLSGAARSLHAGWDVWQLPPSGTWGPRAPLYPHQPLQHSQADHHSVSITMDDHHVWGEGHPAGDGDCPEAGLTNLGSGGGLTCCRKINNMVVPFKQTSESFGCGVKLTSFVWGAMMPCWCSLVSWCVL